MDIVVCIKQVPGTTEVKVDPQTNTLIREGVEAITNPFDAYALEEAVRLKERTGGKVTALSMGPPQADKALRDAISVGVDAAVLLSDPSFAGSDTLATSYTLAKAIEKIGSWDLIICGKQTLDGDTGQVGPELAERLDIPFVTCVRKIKEIGKGFFKMERMIEEGYELVEMPLPGLITVVKEINEPRLPSLRGMMAAKKAEISIWTAQDINAERDMIGIDGSPTRVVKIFTPVREQRSEILEGDLEGQISQLIEKLRQIRVV
ncbi:MAG: electron transfer flavoprotein subunit beta/FixA family protein [Actinomycetota bacterium]